MTNEAVQPNVRPVDAPGSQRIGDAPRDGRPPGSRALANTHLHLPPNFSAFERLDDVVAKAAAEGLLVLGTSNYHDFGVYGPFAEAAGSSGISALFGLEIIALQDDLQAAGVLVNDPSNAGRTYLCGKGIARFDPPNDVAASLLAKMRRSSDERMREMSTRLREVFSVAGLPLETTEASIASDVAARCSVPVDWVALQERHLARAFQEAVFAAMPVDRRRDFLEGLFGAVPTSDPSDSIGLQEEIRSRLMKAGKPAFVPEASVSFEEAYRLVLELGGMPCYPTLADGTSPICGFEDPPEVLADRLLERHIYCAEFIPVRNRRDVLDRYVAAFRQAGIVVTAGTEHNTPRMIAMAPACLDQPLSDSALDAFWEGTCVAVAHQHLASAGETGYVDGDGHLAGEYADGEARIRAFRELGADLILTGQRLADVGTAARTATAGLLK